MPLTAAQLTTLEANETAIDTAVKALASATIANLQQAQLALDSAIANQDAFAKTLVADPTVTPVPPPPNPPTPVPGGTLLAAYFGNGNISRVSSFQAATGITLHGISDYCSGSAWAGITTPPGISNYKGSGLTLCIGINPAPDAMWTPHGGNTSQTWKNVAAGMYDANYVALDNYITKVLGLVPWYRPAWELPANMPWSPVSALDFPVIQAALAHMAHVFKSNNSKCKVDINSLWGPCYTPSGVFIDSAACVPATSPDVDIISVDNYDQSWSGSIFPGGKPNPPNFATPAQSQAAWNDAIHSNSFSITDWALLAANNGKQFAMPETSVAIRNDGQGLGDDPLFMTNTNALMIFTRMAYLSFYPFVDGGGNYDFTGGKFPNTLAKVKSLKW